MLMKTVFFIYCTFVVPSESMTAPGGPFGITIVTSKPSYGIEEEMRLKIVLTNKSPSPIRIGQAVADSQAELDYKITIKDSNGKSMKRKSDIAPDFSIQLQTLDPGQELPEYAVVSRLYDLSRVGTYRVEVSREVPLYLGKGEVKSNVAVFKVVK